MAKYTKEEKQKAVDLYIRYCRQATKVIKELGYPNERHTLVSWYRGYEEKGEVKNDGREKKKLSHVYSEDQVHAAVSFYIEHGKSLSKTIETLGYPHRTRTLKRWIGKLAKEELVQRDYGDTQKRYRAEDVAKALCSSQVRGETSVAEIAKRHGVSRGSIYHMMTKLKDNGYDFNMDKGHNELPQEIKELTEEAERLRNQIEELEEQKRAFLPFPVFAASSFLYCWQQESPLFPGMILFLQEYILTESLLSPVISAILEKLLPFFLSRSILFLSSFVTLM